MLLGECAVHFVTVKNFYIYYASLILLSSIAISGLLIRIISSVIMDLS